MEPRDERFLNQAKTIMEFGARLDRIFNRHTPWYPSEDHKSHAVCNFCGAFWPCQDRKDADWREDEAQDPVSIDP